MEQLTVAQAKEQGYTYYGQSGMDWQHTTSLDDFDPNYLTGKEVLFSKKCTVPSIDIETIKELIGEHLWDQWSDETSDDDAVALCREVKEMPDSIFESVEQAVNEEMAKYHKSYSLTDIRLVP